jgi:hypothetical protein
MRAKSGGARYRREAALKRLLDRRRQEIADKLLGLRELPLPEAAASKDADDHAVDELAREMECQSEREWLERERSPVEAAAESHCHAL